MRYPILTRSECLRLAEIRLAEGDPAPVEPAWVGEGNDFDEGSIQQAAQRCADLVRATPNRDDRDKIEGQAAPYLYRVFSMKLGPG